jgi:hypothetical protein
MLKPPDVLHVCFAVNRSSASYFLQLNQTLLDRFRSRYVLRRHGEALLSISGMRRGSLRPLLLLLLWLMLLWQRLLLMLRLTRSIELLVLL